MSAIIEARRLSRWYGQVTGILDLDLDIGPGVTGLLGPNGAGKSTLLSLITGQLPPSTGSLRVLGEHPWNNPRLMARIGYCSEIDAFYEEMNPVRFLSLLQRLAGVGRRAARLSAERALEIVEISHARDRKLGGFSKGMRQRVKLAQALVNDPDLLVLDEPLNGMDPVARAATVRLVRDLGRSGKHVLVSSHVLHEIEAMTTQVLLVHQGRILAEGDIREIRSLLRDHPHRVEIECSDPRGLAARLLAADHVLSMSLDGEAGKTGSLTITSRRPEELFEVVSRLVLEEKVEVRRLVSADDNLQAVFRYLVR